LENSYGVDLVFVQFGWQLPEMKGHFCHMVAVIFKRTGAFARYAHALLHQSIQRVKARYFCTGLFNQIFFSSV
jgi:hypothetical protein